MGSLDNKTQVLQEIFKKTEEKGISHSNKSNIHKRSSSFILVSFEMFKLYYWNFTTFDLLS